MKKRIISLLLTVSMLLCLSACESSDIRSDTDNPITESKSDTTKKPTKPSQSQPTITASQPTHTHIYHDATCTSPKKCSCGATSGNALGHSYSTATCTSPKTCANCGETDGSALGHSYSDATCTSAKTCNRCNTTVGTALGHQFSTATCTSPKICSRCGVTNGSALGHSYSAATCTSPKTCTRCSTTAGTALGHQFSSATCTSPKICSRCGATNGSALGHNYSAAKCNSPKTCTRCGQTSGSALGHNYVNNKCTRCGKVDPESLPVGLDKLHLIDNSGTLGYTYAYETGSLTDSFGNHYVGYHYFRADDDGEYAIFNLNNTYTILSFDIVAPTEMLSDGKVTIEVFVDDVLKYSTSNFSKTTGKIHANVNVKNGSKLTIKAIRTDGYWIYTANIALVNAQLTK